MATARRHCSHGLRPQIRHASGKSHSSSGAALSGDVATRKPLPSFIVRSSADAGTVFKVEFFASHVGVLIRVIW